MTSTTKKNYHQIIVVVIYKPSFFIWHGTENFLKQYSCVVVVYEKNHSFSSSSGCCLCINLLSPVS